MALVPVSYPAVGPEGENVSLAPFEVFVGVPKLKPLEDRVTITDVLPAWWKDLNVHLKAKDWMALVTIIADKIGAESVISDAIIAAINSIVLAQPPAHILRLLWNLTGLRWIPAQSSERDLADYKTSIITQKPDARFYTSRLSAFVGTSVPSGECAYCLEAFDMSTVFLDCCHAFHRRCQDKFGMQCPTCRQRTAHVISWSDTLVRNFITCSSTESFPLKPVGPLTKGETVYLLGKTPALVMRSRQNVVLLHLNSDDEKRSCLGWVTAGAFSTKRPETIVEIDPDATAITAKSQIEKMIEEAAAYCGRPFKLKLARHANATLRFLEPDTFYYECPGCGDQKVCARDAIEKFLEGLIGIDVKTVDSDDEDEEDEEDEKTTPPVFDFLSRDKCNYCLLRPQTFGCTFCRQHICNECVQKHFGMVVCPVCLPEA